MGRNRYKITSPQHPHFLTLSVLHWMPVFTRPDTVNLVLDCLNYKISLGMKIYAYVILENHTHLVAQSNQSDKDMASTRYIYMQSPYVEVIL